MPEMVAPRALVFRPLVKGNEAPGARLNFLQNKTDFKGIFVSLAIKNPMHVAILATN